MNEKDCKDLVRAMLITEGHVYPSRSSLQLEQEDFDREYRSDFGPQPFPESFTRHLDDNRNLERHMIRVAAMSGMQELGKTCRRLFLNVFSPTRTMWEIADELLSLDYSPVTDFFLERGLERVSYEHEHDCFLFMFKTPPSALLFSRHENRWRPLDMAGVNIRRTLEGSYALATAGFRASSGVSAVSSRRSDRCDSCGNDFEHPPFNRLASCPNCGAPTVGAGNGQQITSAPGIANSSSSGPTIPSHLPSHLISISTRCPGGCGSMIEVYSPATSEGGDPFTSPCIYKCKVRVAAWNKRFDEARKKR